MPSCPCLAVSEPRISPPAGQFRAHTASRSGAWEQVRVLARADATERWLGGAEDTHILELDRPNLPQLVQRVMCSIALHKQLHEVHLLAPKLRHCVAQPCATTNSSKNRRQQATARARIAPTRHTPPRAASRARARPRGLIGPRSAGSGQPQLAASSSGVDVAGHRAMCPRGRRAQTAATLRAAAEPVSPGTGRYRRLPRRTAPPRTIAAGGHRGLRPEPDQGTGSVPAARMRRGPRWRINSWGVGPPASTAVTGVDGTDRRNARISRRVDGPRSPRRSARGSPLASRRWSSTSTSRRVRRRPPCGTPTPAWGTDVGDDRRC